VTRDRAFRQLDGACGELLSIALARYPDRFAAAAYLMKHARSAAL
jgi:hypothetical protein